MLNCWLGEACISMASVFTEKKKKHNPKVANYVLSGRNMCVCAQLFSCVLLFANLWTVTHKAPLSVEFSRQKYWSRLPFPSPGDFPDLRG